MKKLWNVVTMIFITVHVCAQSNDLKLSFQQVILQSEETGSGAEMIRQAYELAAAARQSAIAWSNPEIGLSHERVEFGGITQKETVVHLDKNITMPWVSWMNRRYWGKRLQSEAFQKEAGFSHFLARKKSGYVRLSIMKKKMDVLRQLEQSILVLIQSAKFRETEGMLSGQSRQLIELSLLSVSKMILDNQNEYRSELGSWKIEMGISPEQNVILTTPVQFMAVDPGPLKENTSLLMSNPGLQQRFINHEAGQALVRLEQSRIIPDFSLNLGYKNVDRDFKGYVAGISLPVPVFNWNRGKISEAKISRSFTEIELYRYRNQTENRIQNLLTSLDEMNILATSYTSQDKDFNALIQGLENSYREGWMSALDFINAVQLTGSGMNDYYEFISDYYTTVFELEALTGIQLVVSF